MGAQDIVRLILPWVAALAISKAGWIYATMFQRDRPLSHFQKTVSKYLSLFVLGMGYLVLWQFEVDTAVHIRGFWRALLVLWAGATAGMAIHALRRNPHSPGLVEDKASAAPEVSVASQQIETSPPDFRKP